MSPRSGSAGAVTRSSLRALPELETAFVQRPGTDPICVHRHRPPGAPVAGLLICRPMIADTDANEPREVRVARGATARGVAVNRFFHRGTGDSFGDFATATFEGLVADAELALADLHERVGDVPIAVMGSRLGALVAASLAARHDLDLLMWDPVTDPAAHVRELLRTQMVHLMKVRETGYTSGSLRSMLEDGEMIDIFGWDFPGTVFRSLATELESAIPDTGGSGRRAFVVTTQPGRDGDLSALVPSDVRVERCEIKTREPMWLANFDLALSEPSMEMVSRTVDWVAEHVVGSKRSAPLSLEAPIDAEFGEGPVETPFFLDAGDAQLAAYLTEPAAESNGQGLVIFPGAGHGTAAGPNRLWTRLARELAGNGVTVLRFTYRSTSNSTGDDPVFDLAAPLIDDARAAIDAIRGTGVEEVSLLGWCYGGVAAVAAADRDIRRVILLSPSARANTMGIRSHTDQKAESLGIGDIARKMASPASWRSLTDASHRRNYRRIMRAKSRQMLKGRFGGAGSGPEPAWLNHRYLDDLEMLARHRETEVRMMFGRDDNDHRDHQTLREGRLGRIFDSFGDRLEVHRSNGSIHQLHTPAAQQAALVTVGVWMSGHGPDDPVPTATATSAVVAEPAPSEEEGIETRVVALLLDQMGIPADEVNITSDASLLDEVGLDSVALIRFAMGLENEFDIEIGDDDLVIDNFGTTGRIATYIQGRLENERDNPDDG